MPSTKQTNALLDNTKPVGKCASRRRVASTEARRLKRLLSTSVSIVSSRCVPCSYDSLLGRLCSRTWSRFPRREQPSFGSVWRNAPRANPNGRERAPRAFESALARGAFAPVGRSEAHDDAPSRGTRVAATTDETDEAPRTRICGTGCTWKRAYVIPPPHEPVFVIPNCRLLEAVLRLHLRQRPACPSNA
jgi:hypothetical protein